MDGHRCWPIDNLNSILLPSRYSTLPYSVTMGSVRVYFLVSVFLSSHHRPIGTAITVPIGDTTCGTVFIIMIKLSVLLSGLKHCIGERHFCTSRSRVTADNTHSTWYSNLGTFISNQVEWELCGNKVHT